MFGIRCSSKFDCDFVEMEGNKEKIDFQIMEKYICESNSIFYQLINSFNKFKKGFKKKMIEIA